MYTTHGHLIPGTDQNAPEPEMRARCGGPGLCAQCSREAGAFTNQNKTKESVILEIAAELIDAAVKNGTFAGTHTVFGAFHQAEEIFGTSFKIGDVIDDPVHGEAKVVYINQNGDAAVGYTRHGSGPKFRYHSRDFILSHLRKD